MKVYLRPHALAVLLLFAITILIPNQLFSQGISTGSLSGTTVDSSGAIISGATVNIRNDATDVLIVGKSNNDGMFDVPSLPLGTYTVTVEAPGFGKKKISAVNIKIGRTSLGKIELAVGVSSEVVEVSVATPLLETSQSQISDTFSPSQIANLPLNSGFDKVALLLPGVVQTHDGAFSNNNGASFSSNGNRGRSNNFQFDGQSNNDNSVAGPQLFFGNQDALEAISVTTNTFSAQYGRNSGSVVNYVTKSGTNKFHGTLFEFYEGSWGQSFNQGSKSDFSYFGYCSSKVTTNCTKPTLARYTENRFGGTLGGPIYRDRLWFFSSVMFDRNHQGGGLSRSNNALTPTPTGLTQLASAFPGNPAVAALTAAGPFSVKTGNPTAYNIQNVPVMGPDGVSRNIEFGAVQRSVPSQSNDEEVLGKIDWQPTQKDHLFIRYFYQDNPTVNTNGVGSTTALGRWYDVPGNSHSIGADYTHTFSPTWTNQLRYSFQQSKVLFQGGSQPNCTITTPDRCLTPTSISGTPLAGYSYAGFGTSASNLPQGRVVKVTQVQDNVTWTKGKHSIYFGGEWSYQNSPNGFLPSYAGTLSFSGFANFLKSNGTFGLANGNYTLHFTEPDAAAYFQDDYHILSNLTLNLGLRWEFFGQAINLLHDTTIKRESNAATAIWSTAVPLANRVFPAVSQNYKNFQPRIGFAYTPRYFNQRVVVRGGFSINFDPAFYNMFLNSATAAPVVLLSTGNSCAGTCINNGTTASSFRALNLSKISGGDPGKASQTSVLPNFQNPYTENYNLGVEWSPVSKLVIDLHYVGNHGVKLFQSVNANPNLYNAAVAFPTEFSGLQYCTDSTAPGYHRTNCAKSMVRLRDNSAYSHYNALQLSIKTREYKGLSSTFSFSHSHTLDNASEVFGTFGGGNTNAFSQNPINYSSAEYANSGLDVPNVISASFVYALPFKEKGHGLLGRVLGGIQVNGIYTYDAGNTATPYNYEFGYANSGPSANYDNYCDAGFSNAFNSVYSVCRPYVLNAKAPLTKVAIIDTDGQYYELQDYLNNGGAADGGTPVSASDYHWLYNNKSAAKLHGSAFGGTVGRNTLRSTSWNNLDANIFKDISVKEGYVLQLQITARNALNRQYFGTPDPEMDDAGFWDTRYSNGSSRYIQLGARFKF